MTFHSSKYFNAKKAIFIEEPIRVTCENTLSELHIIPEIMADAPQGNLQEAG